MLAFDEPGRARPRSTTTASSSRSAAPSRCALLAAQRRQQRRPARAGPGAALRGPATAELPPTPITARATTSRWPARSPFSRLIYPVPEQAGLGVHVTIDLGGQVPLRPRLEWVDGIDYDVDPARADGVLRRGAHILAGAAGRRAGAGLCRHPAEDLARGHPGGRLRDPGPGASMACRAWSTCSGSRARA